MTFLQRSVEYFYWLTSERGIKKLAIAGLAVATLAAAYGAYHWYSIRQEESAQHDFAQALEQFERVLAQEGEGKWEEVERAFAAGYAAHSGSALAPFFLAFQAETALELGDTEQARSLMNDAMQKMPRSNPLYHLYAVKRAVMLIDADDIALKDQGLALLQELAGDAQNPYRDMAQFFYGYQAFAVGDKAKAQERWQPLMQESGATSPWALRAQSYLELLQ